jgi:ABC-2 type transport system ATP-binding protein
MREAIVVTDVSKRFRKMQVLNHLSFQVPEGSVFSLIGPNGAGKTTTIKILMNFLQASGRIEVLGTDSRRMGPLLLTQIGYVSENQEMPDWMTVGFYLDYLKPFYPKWDDARLAELLRLFDLPRDRKLRHLSRGMRMKAALASSLAYHPRLLILDEPFSGLDPVIREDLVQALIESAEETTIFISSHDLGEIETFATHIGYLEEGRCQFSEEMTSLTQRFRLVELTLTSEVALATSQWPNSWLCPEMKQKAVRFVESDFRAEQTSNRIRQLFGEVGQVSISPMPLRAIFVALARQQSKAA